MENILNAYRKIMNSGQLTKENLYLKKIRFCHPIFRTLSYTAYKLIYDLMSFVIVKQGHQFYNQDKPISDIFFIMHGTVTL